MASNEDAVREDRLRRRRERDRLRRQTETAKERDTKLKLTSQLHVRVKFCCIDWSDTKIMIGVDVLLGSAHFEGS